MGRELKFRAWDGKQMVYLDDIWWCDEYTSVNFSIKNGGICGFTDIGFKFDEKPLLMQFTGLKDKNGVEIYEGDVVRFGDKGLFFIEWNEEACAFDPLWPDDMSSVFYQEKEVVGNKFEHPHLLSPSQDGESKV